ncbi:MAG TPA: hypothetical protein VMT69_13990 [Kineosporiaceae bacterium]|nr:hypothetical protein [Kineosporiaceae bacterium]
MVSTGLAAAVVVALAVYDLSVATVQLPQRRALIPQEVFLRSPALGFARFGVEFGSGVRTYVTSAAPYGVVVLVLGTTDGPTAGLLIGACFGLGRALAPLQAVVADEVRWSADVAATSRFTERAGSVVVAAVAVWTAVLALR